MHNESRKDREPETPANSEAEPIKPSKLRRIKSAAAQAGIFVIPVAGIGGLMFASYKINKMDLETAKLNLETAKLQEVANLVAQES